MELETPHPSAANLAPPQWSLNHAKLLALADWTADEAQESAFI